MKITDELVDKSALALINAWRESEGLREVTLEDLHSFIGAPAAQEQARVVLEAAAQDITAAEGRAVRSGWNQARNLSLALRGSDIGVYPYPEGEFVLLD